MRASRLLSVLLLLQARGRLTAGDIAGELGVSVRTVYRDLDSLAAAGVPVLAERGSAGGYRLVAGYRTSLTGLTAGESDSLPLAGLPDAAAALGFGLDAAAVERKLLAALPPGNRERATRARELFHLDAPGWFRDVEPVPHLADAAGAVWGRSPIRIVYLRWRTPREVVREVEPLGIVLKSGTWYLVAATADPADDPVDPADAVDPVGTAGTAGAVDPVGTAGTAGAADPAGAAGTAGVAGTAGAVGTAGGTGAVDGVGGASGAVDGAGVTGAGDATAGTGRAVRVYRVYRVGRIQALEVLPGVFPRPEGFDLAEYWAGWTARYEAEVYRGSATVRLSPAGLRLVPHRLAPAMARSIARTAGDPDADGWVRARLPIESVRHARGDLLALGADVEVIAPPELRAAMTEAVADLAALYDRAPRP